MNTQTCKVICLPTQDKTNLFKDKNLFHSIGLEPQTGHSINSSVSGLHLYFLSDDEIQKGDFFLEKSF